MENPYLEKVTRAVDERLDKSTDELNVLALIAIATELRAIRLHLAGDAPPAAAPAPMPAPAPVPASTPAIAVSAVLDAPSDGIVIG